tara:strand:+ start:25286 stop:26602 length:1317 start_codon:yes stop_codon:yes gene_type:complete
MSPEIRVREANTSSINVRVGQADAIKVVSTSTGSGVGGGATTTALNVIGGISSVTRSHVSGLSTFVGIATFGSDLYIERDAFIKRNLTILGETSFGSGSSEISIDSANGILSIGTAIILSSNPTVTIDGDLNVSGISSLGVITGNDLNLSRNLYVTGVSTFQGNVTFQGGTIGLGDSNEDNINISGEFTSSLVPNTDDTYDLGTSSKRWRGANFSRLNVSGVSTLGVTITGNLTSQQLNVSGISTFANNIDANGNLDVDGQTDLDVLNVSDIATFSGLLDANANAQINSLKVEDLSLNRVVIVGTGGELEDDSNLTFDGSTFNIGVSLDVDGQTELDDVNISGITTFGSSVTFGSDLNISQNLDVDGRTELDVTNISETLNVTGISTFASDLDINSSVDVSDNINVTGVSTFVGISSFSNNVNIAGTMTAGEIDGGVY